MPLYKIYEWNSCRINKMYLIRENYYYLRQKQKNAQNRIEILNLISIVTLMKKIYLRPDT